MTNDPKYLQTIWSIDKRVLLLRSYSSSCLSSKFVTVNLFPFYFSCLFKGAATNKIPFIRFEYSLTIDSIRSFGGRWSLSSLTSTHPSTPVQSQTSADHRQFNEIKISILILSCRSSPCLLNPHLQQQQQHRR